jgi:hypothetical protein
VNLLNISTSGLLVSSAVPNLPGRTAEFRMWGRGVDLSVTGRVVRTWSHAGSRGYSYRIAVACDRSLAQLAPVPFAVPMSPVSTVRLMGLISQVNEAGRRGADMRTLRRLFEEALHRLVRVREVRLRDVPMVANDGTESVYFTVPIDADRQPILQATFEPGYAPRQDEFEILEAAAHLAADLLDVENVPVHGAPRALLLSA